MSGLVSQSRGASFIGINAAIVSLWMLIPGSARGDDAGQVSFSPSQLTIAFPRQAADQPLPDDVVVGTASFYDYPGSTASGEPYDPNAFTAAVQYSIRHKFGGIRYGTRYQPAYGIAEYGGKKLVLKFNDVGPLRRGRKFDLSRAAMAYFGGLEKGLLANLKVTRLPIGQTYPTGPLEDQGCLSVLTGCDRLNSNPHVAYEPPAMPGEQVCEAPEEFNTSRNLGHETVLTTLTGDDNVTQHRQSEL